MATFPTKEVEEHVPERFRREAVIDDYAGQEAQDCFLIKHVFEKSNKNRTRMEKDGNGFTIEIRHRTPPENGPNFPPLLEISRSEKLGTTCDEESEDWKIIAIEIIKEAGYEVKTAQPDPRYPIEQEADLLVTANDRDEMRGKYVKIMFRKD